MVEGKGSSIFDLFRLRGSQLEGTGYLYNILGKGGFEIRDVVFEYFGVKILFLIKGECVFRIVCNFYLIC